MLKKTFYILLIIFSKESSGQSFLNGNFEFNSAGRDLTNLTNSQYDNLMANSFAFGNLNGGGPNGGDMDIITSNNYCGLAQSGDWYVALTGGGTDAISLKLNIPLTVGQAYTISFYDRYCSPPSTLVNPFQIGLSTVNNNFGSIIYTAPNAIGAWSLRTFSFVAPNNGQFITVQITAGGANNTWCHIDNFSFDTCAINLNLGNDTTLCQGQTVVLNGGSANSYLWSDGSTNSSINVSTPGTYWLQASNGQCSDRDSINIIFNSAPTVNLGNDTALCQGQTIVLNGGSANSYLWSDGSTNSSINVSTPGTYWLQASNGQCSDRDSINIIFNSAPTVNLGNDTTLCQGQTIVLNGGSANSYLWSDGSTNSSFNVSTPGTYWLQASNGECSDRDSINIIFNSAPTVNLGNDTTLCQGQTVTLNVGLATSYLWSNGSTASSINVSQQGAFWVEVRNNCLVNSDTIVINFKDCDCDVYIPNAFTPNMDNLNDTFLSISNCEFLEYKLKIFNRWGEKIFETNSSIESWNGTYLGEIAPIGVYVYLVTYQFEKENRKKKCGTINLIR